jgi:hypothetical protein
MSTLMVKALSELVGTYVFLGAGYATRWNPIALGLSLAFVVMMVGAAANPVASLIQLMDGSLRSLPDFIVMVVNQILAGIAIYLTVPVVV